MASREPQTRTRHTKPNLGPTCAHCPASEAACARTGSCCRACTHWLRFTADGNLNETPGPQRRVA